MVSSATALPTDTNTDNDPDYDGYLDYRINENLTPVPEEGFFEMDDNLSLSDDSIKTSIIEQINSDAGLRAHNGITIEVEDGVVTLDGTVKNRDIKFNFYSLAYWTNGVIDVVNNLRVDSKA